LVPNQFHISGQKNTSFIAFVTYDSGSIEFELLNSRDTEEFIKILQSRKFNFLKNLPYPHIFFRVVACLFPHFLKSIHIHGGQHTVPQGVLEHRALSPE